MAITRIWQSGWELQSEALELTAETTSLNTTYAKTGIRSLNITTANNGTGYYEHSAALTQCRLGFHWRQDGNTALSGALNICSLRSGTTAICSIQYNIFTSEWVVLCGSTEVGRQSDPVANARNTWMHIGVDVKIDGAAGWVQVYRDGNLIINFSGDTNDGGANFNRLYWGSSTGSVWTTTMVDDCYWDNTAGEGAGAAPPDLRFQYILPNGDGNYSNWTGSDGNSVNNSLLVDELPPSSTDYVSVTTQPVTDSYALADYTPTPGATVAAVIPTAMALKDLAGTTLKLALGTRLSATDVVGTAQALTTGYLRYWERQTTKPGGGAWTESDVDSAEVVIQSGA